MRPLGLSSSMRTRCVLRWSRRAGQQPIRGRMAELVSVPVQSSGHSHSHSWGDPKWGAQNPTGQGPTQLLTQLPTLGIKRALYTPLPSSPCQGSHGGSSPGGHEGSRRGGRGREPRQEKVLGSSRTPEAWRGAFFIITPLSSKVQPPPALS